MTRVISPLIVLLLLTATGCDESSDPIEQETTPTAGSTTGGEFSVYTCEPEHLIPSNVSETCGAQVVSSLFRGLINYAAEDMSATLEDAVAQSITTEDDQTFTVKLKEGWTFHNGDPVDAQAFVDTWNFATYAPNAQQNADFLSNIEGYGAVNPSVPEGESQAPEPAAETLSGLEVIDDLTFEVTLSEPFAQWPLTLGYTAFFPLPSEAFDDPEAFERSPIGNGPFQMDGDWEHNQQIRQVRYEDYAGSQPATADAVVYRIYADINTAYDDLLAGELDIIDSIPREELGSAGRRFGDRFIERPSSVFQFLGIPMYDDQLGMASGEAGRKRRRALSLAIDREEIAEEIFAGSERPAYGFISPAVIGSRDRACPGMEHDGDEARALWSEAGGYEGPLTLWFNTDAGHGDWLNAVAAQWRETLGVQDVRFEQLPFGDYLTLGADQGFTGPFRLGWGFEYPSPRNYLEPLYATGSHPPAGHNYAFYSNEEFDSLLQAASQTETLEEATALYQDAEDILCEDLPVIPQRWGLVHGAHSERVSGVAIDAFSVIRVNRVTVGGG